MFRSGWKGNLRLCREGSWEIGYLIGEVSNLNLRKAWTAGKEAEEDVS